MKFSRLLGKMDIVEIGIACGLFACTLFMLICCVGAIVAIARSYTGCFPK